MNTSSMHHTVSRTTQGVMHVLTGIMFAGVIFLLGTQHAFAAGTTGYCATGVPDTLVAGSSNLGDFVKYIACFLQGSIVPLLFALAICVFIYGMVKFIGTQESSEREQGKQFMLWGIVALAVMFSVWGLVSLLGNTFGVKNVIPQLPVD